MKMNDAPKKLKIINMANVEPKQVIWLWYPYIPYGKITIVQGDPGEGKTTFILQLAALLSKAINYHLTRKNVNPSTLYTRQQKMAWKIQSNHV